ncbi:MAG: ankyrin repeat domain-containing protein [Planctomycetota bacterium]
MFRHVLLIAAIITPFGSVIARDDRGQLSDAILNGDSVMVQALIKKGVDIESKIETGETALYEAVSVAEPKIVDQLLSAGAKVDVKDNEYGMPIFNMAVSTGNREIVESLIRAGAPVDQLDRFGGSALGEAAFIGSSSLFLRCTQLGVKDREPFHHACGLGRIDKIKEMIKSGTDVNEASQSWKNSSLMFAIAGGQPKVVAFLLANGARTNTRNVLTQTPLHLAANRETPEMVLLLLETDAKINAKMNTGETPLDYAYQEEVIHELKKRNAVSGFND